MLGHSDKRNYYRMMVNSQVQLMINDPQSGRVINAICRDLSSTGMSLEIDEPLEMGIMLYIKMQSSNPSIPPLSAHAKSNALRSGTRRLLPAGCANHRAKLTSLLRSAYCYLVLQLISGAS